MSVLLPPEITDEARERLLLAPVDGMDALRIAQHLSGGLCRVPPPPRRETMSSFRKGFLIGLPISMVLWAIIIAAIRMLG